MVHAKRETKKEKIDLYEITDMEIYRQLAKLIITKMNEEHFNYLFQTSVKQKNKPEGIVLEHNIRVRHIQMSQCVHMIYNKKKRILFKKLRKLFKR